MKFANLYTLLDAVMLFGGMLEPIDRGAGNVRIVVARSRRQWPLLYWMITLLYRHGVVLRLKSGAASAGEKLDFASAPSCFYAHAFHRWYPAYASDGRRQAIAPGDLTLDDAALTVWLADGLARTSPERPGGAEGWIRLSAPRMSQAAAAGLAEQVAALSRAAGEAWRVEMAPTDRYWSVRLDGRDRQSLEGWMSQRRIPSPVWTGMEEHS